MVSAGGEAAIASYRTYQGVQALQNEDNLTAAARFGEAALRLIGVGVNTAAYLKAVGRAKIVIPKTVPGGGLAAHEAAGGHTIAKHVGKSDADLAARLVAEPRIRGSSSFPDLATAEKATSDALQAKSSDIATWLTGSTLRMPAFEVNVGYNTGRSLLRGTSGATDVQSVRIVLQRDSTLSTGYKIITSFPVP